MLRAARLDVMIKFQHVLEPEQGFEEGRELVTSV